MNLARDLWMRIETLHAVTYFGDESQQAAKALGVPGFWLGYFGMRAAPMGTVGAGVVEATFFNFVPAFVRRWVPAVWDIAPPEAFVAVRAEAAAATLRRVGAPVENLTALNADLQRVVDRCGCAGRPLFAANREVDLPNDSVAALWQLCTSLREHRGDGHVAALTAAGIDGIEAHVLITLQSGGDAEDLQRTRGWSADDWDHALQRLQGRDLVAAPDVLTDAGRQLRLDIETTTDQLAFEPWRQLADADVRHVLQSLSPAAESVSASGVIRYPNPIGLPPLA